MFGLGWTYRQRGALIHGGQFVLGLGQTYTYRSTYSWREVYVRFRMDLHTGGALIHGDRFVLGLGWTFTLGGHLFMEGSLC